jgi:hypothetical protein
MVSEVGIWSGVLGVEVPGKVGSLADLGLCPSSIAVFGYHRRAVQKPDVCF